MHHLEARDREAALALVRRRSADGVTGSDLITTLLAPAQRRVGTLWQDDHWNVAQEHAATAIVDAALAELELANHTAPSRGSVVVTCAEGEWHALPARMLAEELRHLGWGVTFLGGSTPARDLARFIAAVEPVAVAISCSMATLLPGAQRSIEAVHRHGLPVLAGGLGLGADPARAVAIGADGWAATAAGAVEVLDGWSERRPSLGAAGSQRAAIAFAAVRADLLRSAPAAASQPQVHDALGQVLRAAEAALAAHDPTVLTEVLTWSWSVGAPRGLEPTHFEQGVAELAKAAAHDHPAARALLERAARDVHDVVTVRRGRAGRVAPPPCAPG